MAKYPIPIHMAKTESGVDKIITAKTKVKELGANAFIVSKAMAAKLSAAPAPAPMIDYDKLAGAAAQAVLAMPACSLSRNPFGAIKRAMEDTDD